MSDNASCVQWFCRRSLEELFGVVLGFRCNMGQKSRIMSISPHGLNFGEAQPARYLKTLAPRGRRAKEIQSTCARPDAYDTSCSFALPRNRWGERNWSFGTGAR